MANFSTSDQREARFRSGAQGYRISKAIYSNIDGLLRRAGFEIESHVKIEDWKTIKRGSIEVDIFFGAPDKDGYYTFCWMPPGTGWNGIELDLIFYASHAGVFSCPGAEVYASTSDFVPVADVARRFNEIIGVCIDFALPGIGVELPENIWLRYGPALALDTCEERTFIAIDYPKVFFRRSRRMRIDRVLIEIWRILFQFGFQMVGRQIPFSESFPFGFLRP